MNKSEFTKAVAAEAKMEKKEVEAVLEAYKKVVIKALKKGEKINLTGFMIMRKAVRKARTARNPQTGKEVKVPAKNVARFRAAKAVTDLLN